MANNFVSVEPPKAWEVLGTVLGYLAVAKDVPQTLRLLSAGMPGFIRHRLNWIPGVSDGFILFWFTVTLAFGSSWLLWRTRSAAPEEESDSDDRYMARAEATLKRWRVVRALRSFGLTALRDWLLGRLGIAYYRSFARPAVWGDAPGRTDQIDRLGFLNGGGVEYQYSAAHDVLYVREHEPPTGTGAPPYGDEQRRAPNKRDRTLLMIEATWTFLPWYLRHLWKRRHSVQTDGADPPSIAPT